MPELEQSPNAKKLLSPVKSYAKDKFKNYNSQIIDVSPTPKGNLENQLYIGKHKKSNTTHLGGNGGES